MQTNQYIDEKIKVKTFWGGNGYSSYVDMVYTDKFFLESAENYDPSLAVASLLMGETTTPVITGVIGPNEGENFYKRCHFFGDLLVDNLGFFDVQYNDDWYSNPTTNSIGASVARKLVTPNSGEQFYLIAVGLRGGNYGGEWSNNFEIGNTINHKGFEESAEKVYEFVNKYIENILKDNTINKIKFWISGYSRGAAVSSMLGYKLNKVISNKNEPLSEKTSKDDLFVYTFETPRSLNAFDPSDFKNIHNIINPYDIVTMVPPEAFDYIRPGVDYLLPVFDNEKVTNAKKFLRHFNHSFSYNFDDFVYYETEFRGLNALFNLGNAKASKDSIKLNEFDKNLFDHMAEIIVTRSEFYSKYETPLCDIMGFLFGEIDVYALINKLKDELPSIKKYIVSSALNNLINLVDDTDVGACKAIVDVFCKILKKAIIECGGTPKRAHQIEGNVKILAPSLIKFMEKYPNDVVTFINNFSIIPNAHYPDLCLSWVTSLCDDYAYLVK